MWSEKLKISKQLVRSLTNAGFLSPKEIQVKSITRIIGGQDLICVGPEGSGKTTTYVLGVLARLKFGFEEAPRALILVPDKDSVLAVIERFELLNDNKTIRIVGLYAAPGIEAQMNALTDGVDIVVATPDRARALYLKLGLNLNKIQMFVVDDAELIVKQGLQLPVKELANSIIKCQHLVFTEVMHEKLDLMIDPFINDPAIIEVDELGEQAETYEQILYHVPNFRTKLNLLDLLLEDREVFTKTVVFVNSRLTAEKVYSSLKIRFKKEVAILNPMFFESEGFAHIEDFKESGDSRILLIANEFKGYHDLEAIPFLINLELPEEKEIYLQRIIKETNDPNENPLFITFSTDIELNLVKKIEQAIGQKITIAELPEDLIVEKEAKNKKKSSVKEEQNQTVGAAFHDKKESNVKTYNYSSRVKAKMNKKKNH